MNEWKRPWKISHIQSCPKKKLYSNTRSKTGWQFVPKAAYLSAYNVVHNVIYCLLLCFTASFSPAFCPIFIIFRQPVNLDSCCIWAAPSSRLTPNTLFVWRRASCGSLWPEHCSFESPFSFLITASSSRAAVSRHASKFSPGVELRCFSNSHHLRRQKCRKRIQCFSFFCFKIPCRPLHSPHHTYQCFCSWIQQSEADWPINTLSEEVAR